MQKFTLPQNNRRESSFSDRMGDFQFELAEKKDKSSSKSFKDFMKDKPEKKPVDQDD